MVVGFSAACGLVVESLGVFGGWSLRVMFWGAGFAVLYVVCGFCCWVGFSCLCCFWTVCCL